MNFKNINTFTYQKALLNTLICLFLKASKAFSVSLIEGFLGIYKLSRRNDSSDQQWLMDHLEKFCFHYFN